ncbi:hypothetical protein QJS66_15610 [Kocuria rhizophila]|nr:hypothetical protein QJS66_15610 [Kocuria rhizophila]
MVERLLPVVARPPPPRAPGKCHRPGHGGLSDLELTIEVFKRLLTGR